MISPMVIDRIIKYKNKALINLIINIITVKTNFDSILFRAFMTTSHIKIIPVYRVDKIVDKCLIIQRAQTQRKILSKSLIL
jgi:hypothetical protein